MRAAWYWGDNDSGTNNPYGALVITPSYILRPSTSWGSVGGYFCSLVLVERSWNTRIKKY
jgi:hypothetical protein